MKGKGGTWKVKGGAERGAKKKLNQQIARTKELDILARFRKA